MPRPPAQAKCYRTGLPKSPFSKGGLQYPPLKKGGRGDFSSPGVRHLWFMDVSKTESVGCALRTTLFLRLSRERLSVTHL